MIDTSGIKKGCFLFCATVLSLAYCVGASVTAADTTEGNDILKNNQQEKEPKYYEITKNDGVDPYWVEKVNEQLSYVPEKIIEDFEENGWEIYATSKDIDATFYGGKYGAVKGTTGWETHKIYIEDREEAVDTAVIHEMGHFVDCYLGNPSQTETINMYYEEAEDYASYFDVKFHYDSLEYFADAFFTYLTSPEELKECAPQIYGWWDDTVKNWK